MTSADKCVSLIGWSRPEKRLHKDTRSTAIVWLKLSDGIDRHGKH